MSPLSLSAVSVCCPILTFMSEQASFGSLTTSSGFHSTSDLMLTRFIPGPFWLLFRSILIIGLLSITFPDSVPGCLTFHSDHLLDGTDWIDAHSASVFSSSLRTEGSSLFLLLLRLRPVMLCFTSILSMMEFFICLFRSWLLPLLFSNLCHRWMFWISYRSTRANIWAASHIPFGFNSSNRSFTRCGKCHLTSSIIHSSFLGSSRFFACVADLRK